MVTVMGVNILASEDQKHFYSKQDLHPGFLFLSRSSQTLSQEDFFLKFLITAFFFVSILDLSRHVHFPFLKQIKQKTWVSNLRKLPSMRKLPVEMTPVEKCRKSRNHSIVLDLNALYPQLHVEGTKQENAGLLIICMNTDKQRKLSLDLSVWMHICGDKYLRESVFH